MHNEPTASGPHEEPIFDQEAALAMLAGDIDLLNEVITAFLDHAPGLVQELASAIDAKDFANAERVAHAIKGAALNVHAARVRQKAAEVEASAQATDEGSISRQFEELREELARFEAHLASIDWHAPRGRGQQGT